MKALIQGTRTTYCGFCLAREVLGRERGCSSQKRKLNDTEKIGDCLDSSIKPQSLTRIKKNTGVKRNIDLGLYAEADTVNLVWPN